MGVASGWENDIERINGRGMESLRAYLGRGEAVAFLGAGASAPLYPMWGALVADLVDQATARASATGRPRRAGD